VLDHLQHLKMAIGIAGVESTMEALTLLTRNKCMNIRHRQLRGTDHGHPQSGSPTTAAFAWHWWRHLAHRVACSGPLESGQEHDPAKVPPGLCSKQICSHNTKSSGSCNHRTKHVRLHRGRLMWQAPVQDRGATAVSMRKHRGQLQHRRTSM
jgi:hypothetical protein